MTKQKTRRTSKGERSLKRPVNEAGQVAQNPAHTHTTTREMIHDTILLHRTAVSPRRLQEIPSVTCPHSRDRPGLGLAVIWLLARCCVGSGGLRAGEDAAVSGSDPSGDGCCCLCRKQALLKGQRPTSFKSPPGLKTVSNK